jgi:hypothetical protein
MDINSYSRNSFEYTLLYAIAEGQVVGRVREACEQWVATQDRFNSWFLRVPKRHYSEDRLLRLIENAEDAREVAVAAWKTYETVPNPETEEIAFDALSRSSKKIASLIEEPA